MAEQVERVGVVGCGLMGSGIAEVSARAGLDVVIAELDPSLAEQGLARIERSLARAVSGGKLSESARDEVVARISIAKQMGDLADRQVVFEAVTEREDAKSEVLRRVDEVLEDPAAVIGSNTSSIPIVRLATATAHPERVIGIHFFNPVPVMPLVELVRSLRTSDATAARAREVVTGNLGKVVIDGPDRAGFVVNALLVPYLLAAVRMLESGLASPEDIDQGMVSGCNHPMGPLRLADFIGLDTVKQIGEVLFEEFKEPLYAPPPLLSRMVEAGWTGRKSGRGFYTYG